MRRLAKLSLSVAAVALATAGVAACSGGADSGGPAATTQSSGPTKSAEQASGNLDPCTLFAISDFEQVWNITLKTSTQSDPELKNSNSKVRNCKFEQAEGGAVKSFTAAYQFVVEITTFDSAADAEAKFNSNKSSLEQFATNKDLIASPVQIADGAYFNVASIGSESTTNSYLVVRKGSQLIAMSSTRLDGVVQEKNRANLIQLAQRKL